MTKVFKKLRKIDWDFVKREYPILYNKIDSELSHLLQQDKQLIADLVLQAITLSSGTVDFLSDEPFLSDITDKDLLEDFQ